MSIHQLLAFSAAALALSILPGRAGPCSEAIDSMQARVDAFLEGKAAAGAEAPESADALRHRQPTPSSIAAAEARLREVSSQTVEVIAAGLARAREADEADDRSGCERALADVERAIGP